MNKNIISIPCLNITTHTILMLLIFLSVAHCSPPEDPVQCRDATNNKDCTVTNSIGIFPDRTTCRAAKAVYPTTEAELLSVVASGTKAKRKMKVTTRYSHSIPKLVCPDGNNGTLISTKNLNRIMSMDPVSMTATVETGVTLRQLIAEAAKVEMVFPYAPYWWGLTIGGMLGTGAHGSSLWGKGSQVHDHVVGMRVVTPGTEAEGYAKVRVLDSDDPDMDAVKVSLGVLGVISQVTLKLQPLFKRSITYVSKNDSNLGSEAASFGRKHEFGDITWFPSQKTAVYRIDDRTSSTSIPGNGLLDFPGFRSTPRLVLSAVRIAEEKLESHGNINGKCVKGKIATTAIRKLAYGLTNDEKKFTSYPVIGYHNRVQASGTCLDSHENGLLTACPWDHRVKGVFYHQTTFSITLSKVQRFVEDVQSLVALQPKSLCGLDIYNGILARYVTRSTAYLGKQEDGLDFDITYYRSKDPLIPRLFEDVLEEIEQMAMFKYGALPHWGKNRNVAFVGAISKYKNATMFLKVKEKYDSMGLFSSDWTNQILGLKGGLTTIKEGCALEGLCICSEDVHCSPKTGYFCRPGKVYKEARVCTKVDNTKDMIME